MQLHEHFSTTGTALKNWFIAQTFDSLAVASLWLIGLLLIGIPLAPLWAVLAAFFQFIPGIGGVFALIGPILTAVFVYGDEYILLYVLGLYGAIAALDGLFLQPYLMKRTSRVPIWASILTPIVLGIVIPFWGVLLSPPLLAIIYAYKARSQSAKSAGPPGLWPGR